MTISFKDLRVANVARIPQFRDAKGNICHTKVDGSDWSPAEWLQATVGELGELVNVLKKVKRGDYTLESALPEIRKEFADVFIYLDIFAMQFGIDLGGAVRDKFNEVSRRVGSDVFIFGEPDPEATIRVPPGFGQVNGRHTKYPIIAIQVRGVANAKDNVATVTVAYSELEYKESDAYEFANLLTARLANAFHELGNEVVFTATKREKKDEPTSGT